MESPSLEAVERIPADFRQDPYDLPEHFRGRGPVHEVVRAHGAEAWLATGHDEVRRDDSGLLSPPVRLTPPEDADVRP